MKGNLPSISDIFQYCEMKQIIVRKGEISDTGQIMDLIRELAEYENALHEVKIDEKVLVSEGFSDQPTFRTLVAEQDGKVVGTMIYYFIFSTWKGKCFHLEDFVVSPLHRRKGIGEKLFEALIEDARHENLPQIRWQVLNWNTPAIDFYNKLEATIDKEWYYCSLPI